MTVPQAKALARSMWEQDGMDVKAIRVCLLMRGVDKSEMTIRRWVSPYAAQVERDRQNAQRAHARAAR